MPFHLVGKDYNKIYNFYYEILLKLLNINLRNNIFYFFTNDPFYLGSNSKFGKNFNNIIDILYKNKNNNIKIINPLFNFQNINFSTKQERCCFPLISNYDDILFFPYIHYCYKLSKLNINLSPIKKVFNYLYNIYEPHNNKLYKLLGRKIPDWIEYYNKMITK